MDQARIRVLVFLDDGNFVASDWVDFKIEQPDVKEEDWSDDITVERKLGDARELYSYRAGLLQHRVGGEPHWFVAFEGPPTLNLTRLPIQNIHQVIPAQHPDAGPRGAITVLGTAESGEWFVYLPNREHIDQPIRSLGSDKKWRLHVREDGRVEVLEADSR